MMNKSIPRLIKKIKNPILKLLSNIFSYIYRHKIIIIVLLIVFTLFYEEFTKQEYIIKPFEVPKLLEENGFTGQVIVHQIIDKIYEIKREALTKKQLEEFGSKESEPLPEIIVPGAGISIKPILRYLKTNFSPYKPIVITGEIIRENTSIYLTTRIMGKPPHTFGPVKIGNFRIDNLMMDNDSDKIKDFECLMDNDSHNVKDFECLMLQAAIHIYRYTDPFILASYYNHSDNREDALKIVEEIVRDKENANKKWAYNLWGIILANKDKSDKAIEKYKRALREDSEFVNAHYNLGNVYSTVDYDKRDYSKAKESYKKAIDFRSTVC